MSTLIEQLENTPDVQSRAREAAAELRRLSAENDALRADAERYRWLRTAGAWESEIGLDALSKSPEKFDAAIDAVIEAYQRKQEG
jgi:hypothetical protein